MRKIWVITKREVSSYFDSLIAYVMIVIFLGLSGFFTWITSSNVFFIGQADLQVFFGISYWTLFFFIPAITMRSLAEENKSGTIELLSTKAVSDWQIVSGKFLSCSKFPECKFAKSITTGVKCPSPDCGGELVRRKSKRGYFYGCTNYPKCKYVSKSLPARKE